MQAARPGGLAFLTARPIAHRGLHGEGVPENSLAAARAAIAAGYGMECDVRLSRDGVAHVFHDRDLARMTGAPGRLADLDARAIARLRLESSDEPPPTLAALLGLCTWRQLVIELKSDGDARATARLCAAVARALAGQEGGVAVMSFDAYVCRWFALHAPHVPRGLTLSARHPRGLMRGANKALAIRRARPHFLARDVRDLLGAPRQDRLPLLCWTVRTAHQRALAAAHHAQIIFEG